MSEVNAKKFVSEAIETIKSVEQTFHDQIYQGRRGMWKVLGSIYEVGKQIEGDEDRVRALADHVDALPEIQDKPKWIASQKGVFENLLVAALGYKGTESKRHYYVSAMLNASKDGIEPDGDSFAEWIEKKDGVIAAAKGAEPRSSGSPADVITKYTDELPEDFEGEIITVDLPSEGLPSGLAVLVVRTMGDGTAEVLKKVFKAQSIAAAIASTEMTEGQVQRERNLAIWDMNSYPAKETKLIRGGLKPKDAERFVEAVNILDALPGRETYFNGPAEVRRDGAELAVMNTNFHRLDPGRYVANAIEGALVPYAFDPELEFKKGVKTEAFQKYRQNPPRRKSQAKSAKTEA